MKRKKVIITTFVVLGVLAMLVPIVSIFITNYQASKGVDNHSVSKMALSAEEQEQFVEKLQSMLEEGYKPTEIDAELSKKVSSLDEEHSTLAVRTLMKSIEDMSMYFGQMLFYLGNEIEYAQMVDQVKDPVKDKDKLSNEFIKGYFKEIERQFLKPKVLEGYLYIEPDAQYILDKYGTRIGDIYKDYLNLVAHQQKNPLIDTEKGRYDLERVAEDLLAIDNARNRWENTEFHDDWQNLERNLYEAFFSYSHATFFEEKILNEGEENESYTYFLNEEVRKQYEDIMLANKDTYLAKDIEKFLAKLDETKNEITDDIDKFIEDLVLQRYNDSDSEESEETGEQKDSQDEEFQSENE